MAIVDSLLPEFEREMATTRALLARVPDDRFDWKPHAKSMSMGALASHITEMASWGEVIARPEFEVTSAPSTPQAASSAELLTAFDRNVSATTSQLAGRTDAELLAAWKVTRDGETMFTMPKVTMLRSILLNHLIHHRGQLTVYLRLNDVPLPPIYGPTADSATSP
jgi:uncharacterized damage-inducible protein DinB